MDQLNLLISARKAMRMLSTSKLVDADCPYVSFALIDTGSSRSILQAGRFVFQGDSPYNSAPFHATKMAEDTIQELRYTNPRSEKAILDRGQIFLTTDVSGDRIAIAVGGVSVELAKRIIDFLAKQLAHENFIVLP